MTVSSPVLRDGAALPIEYTCDGNDTLPAVRWSAVPSGTQSLVLLLEESEGSEQRTMLLLYHLGAGASEASHEALPAGARFGRNDFEVTRYSGPCPPRGEGRRYALRVLALDTPMDLREGLSRREVDMAMDGHVLATGSLRFSFGH
jgi:Raf kinase inhibitor-like YbhB/YbcL family protein